MWTEYIWGRDDLQWKTYPRALAIAEIGWVPDEKKNWERFVHEYAAHQSVALKNMGIVEPGLSFVSNKWNKGELSKDKWVSVEFPLDQAINKATGSVEAAFAHTNVGTTHIRNVKLLFSDALAAQDDHEGVTSSDTISKSTYLLNTKVECTPENIKIQAEMMCEGGDDCEGTIYLYLNR